MREPMEKPRPARASAGDMAAIAGNASASITATACIARRVVFVKFMLFSRPLKGEAPLRWVASRKSEDVVGRGPAALGRGPNGIAGRNDGPYCVAMVSFTAATS